jgi:hypothetical protein
MISNSMSKVDALKEKEELDSFMGWHLSQFSKSYSWGVRLSMQTEAQRQYKSKNIANRTKTIDSILSNPSNISRWNKEEKAEKKRILDIELEKQRLLDEAEDLRLNTEFRLFYLQDIENKRLQQIKDQEITFNEQTNSGDFNETPITDVNVNSGCSECTGEKWTDPIIKKGYHTMPDGSLMKDSDMEKKPLNNNMKFAGIAAAGVIGLLLYTKGGLK